VAVVALARKMLCLIHHLLLIKKCPKRWVANQERDAPIPKNKNPAILTIEDVIQFIAQAGYEVKKVNFGADGQCR